MIQTKTIRWTLGALAASLVLTSCADRDTLSIVGAKNTWDRFACVEVSSSTPQLVNGTLDIGPSTFLTNAGYKATLEIKSNLTGQVNIDNYAWGQAGVVALESVDVTVIDPTKDDLNRVVIDTRTYRVGGTVTNDNNGFVLTPIVAKEDVTNELLPLGLVPVPGNRYPLAAEVVIWGNAGGVPVASSTFTLPFDVCNDCLFNVGVQRSNDGELVVDAEGVPVCIDPSQNFTQSGSVVFGCMNPNQDGPQTFCD
jgi:hypothetical protein